MYIDYSHQLNDLILNHNLYVCMYDSTGEEAHALAADKQPCIMMHACMHVSYKLQLLACMRMNV